MVVPSTTMTVLKCWLIPGNPEPDSRGTSRGMALKRSESYFFSANIRIGVPARQARMFSIAAG